MKILYKKTELSYIILFTMLSSIAFIIVAYIYQIGNKTLPLFATIIVLGLLLLVLLLFYKLTIEINEQKITAYFGIGLIKRSILLSEIDINTIEEVNAPWYYGIGLRITPKGILYNIKFGNAIYFKSKDKKQTFFVGTDDFEDIKEILLKANEN